MEIDSPKYSVRIAAVRFLLADRMTHPVDAGKREEVQMGNAVIPVLLSYPRALDVIVDTATTIL